MFTMYNYGKNRLNELELQADILDDRINQLIMELESVRMVESKEYETATKNRIIELLAQMSRIEQDLNATLLLIACNMGLKAEA